ncbi:MAG TPA: tetratricopeptide repeat protein [Pyrinomonadaceae bacterium]|nr:tetratricopeptide repeat protein [Pyrinomonadaceae bacterium]
MRYKFYIFVLVVLAIGLSDFSMAQTAAARSITVMTEPNAIVWMDDIRRGTTDASGKLLIRTVPNGVRKLRVRADGFKEAAQTLTAAQKGVVKVVLVKTADEAELTFQQAEAATTVDREKAVELYRKAISLRPRFAEAQLGLARVLLDSNNTVDSMKALREARKIKPVYPEASAVEGRIYRSEGEDEKAIAAFRRAIREGKGFQPEAHAGLGLLYKERAEAFGSEGDLEQEKTNYDLAAAAFRLALTQLSGAPDAEVIYQMLGVSYERQQKYAEAIKIYEEFLRVFPDSAEASAVRSFIVQLQKQMKEQ